MSHRVLEESTEKFSYKTAVILNVQGIANSRPYTLAVIFEHLVNLEQASIL